MCNNFGPTCKMKHKMCSNYYLRWKLQPNTVDLIQVSYPFGLNFLEHKTIMVKVPVHTSCVKYWESTSHDRGAKFFFWQLPNKAFILSQEVK